MMFAVIISVSTNAVYILTSTP